MTQRIRRLGSASVALLLVGALGCPGKQTGTGNGTGSDTPGADGGPSFSSKLILSRVGAGTLYAQPGDVVTLTGLLVDSNGTSEVTPVPNTEVDWKFTQLPGPATFGNAGTSETSTTSTTDMNGLATAQVTIGEAYTSAASLVLSATSTNAASTAIWEIQVNPITKVLQIIPNPPEIQLSSSTGTAAIVNAVYSEPTQLQVRAYSVQMSANGATNAPLANEPIVFQFASSCGSPGLQDTLGNTLTSPTTVITDNTGVATLVLVGGEGGCPSPADVLLATDGNVNVTFDVEQAAKPPPCNTSSQCGTGWACIGGVCTPQTTGTTPNGSCNGTDLGCPIGYNCDNGACVPATESGCGTCPNGEICNTNTGQCTTGNPQCGETADGGVISCPSGSTCQNGTCIPGTTDVINITGNWYTQHYFNVEAALPSWLQTTGTVVRILDQILQGQLPLPAIIDAIIQALVQQYIPSWVVTVVYIIDNMFTIFSDLRAAGEMLLTALNNSNGTPNYSLIQGTESWDHFIFYLLSQCGMNIGGNPTVPPPCAEVDVYTTQLNAANLAVTVNPFTGTVVGGPTMSNPSQPWTFMVNPRTVNMSLAGIVLYVINQVIAATTGYPSLQGPPGDPQAGALYHLVDCPGLGQLANGIIPGLGSAVTAACEAFVAQAADAIAQQLNNITITGQVLTFQGQATAQPGPGEPMYATQLGYSDNLNFQNPHTPPDGVWNATFGTILGDVPGRWYASRSPIPNPTQ